MVANLPRTTVLICILGLSLTGCGPESAPDKNGSPNNTANNTHGSTSNTTTGPNNTTGSTNNSTSNTNNDTSSSNNQTNNNTSSSNNQTNNTTNNTNNNNNTNNQTNNTPQCTAGGEPCMAGRRVNAGFVCVEETCRFTCDPANPFCAGDELCLGATASGPFYCQPSDCTGWLDTSCDADETCVVFEGVAVCTASGAAAKGDPCTDFPDCGPGLFCAFGACTELCGSDAACDVVDGERCLDDTIAAGVGVCAVGCDSYSTGQCPTGQGCFPVTATDGVCDVVGTVGPYQPCTQGECGENTACITFQAADTVNNVPEVGRCLPFCDPTAGSQSASNATCMTVGTLGGHCLDLSDDMPTPNSGFCLEDCADSDAFGTGACSGPSDHCTPITGGVLACFPGGPNTVGQACDLSDLTDGCDGVSYCEASGGGSGTCRGWCQPQTQSNNLLGCAADRVCVATASTSQDLGRCRDDCTPTNFVDTSCPAGLQTCIPDEPQGSSYCSASGATALGGICEVLAGDCLAGDSCLNGFRRGDLTAEPFAGGTCANLCDPFGDGTECTANQVCAIDWLTLSRTAGHCVVPDEDVPTNGSCGSEFSVCGDRSLCFDGGVGPQCFELCDLDAATSSCSTGICQQLFNDASIRLGACL